MIKLIEMGVELQVFPIWGTMKSKGVLLMFNSTEAEVKIADVELLLRILRRKLCEKYPKFRFSLAVEHNGKVLCGPI